MAANPGENYFIAEGRANDSEASITHTYASGGPFTASLDGCCTISELNNASDSSYRAGTVVDMGADDESPRSSVPPVVNVGTSGQQTYNVPAIDSGGEKLRWRLATGEEACGGCSDPQPPGDFSIDPNTGRVTWTTTEQAEGLYFTSVVIDALNAAGAAISSTQVTYLVRVGSGGINNQPPAFEAPTPEDGARFEVAPGAAFQIPLQARDPDILNTVSLNNLGLPEGATFEQTPGNPATGTFRWTPTAAQAGEHLLTVVAQDDADPPASVTRTYVIEVTGQADTTPPAVSLTSPPDGSSTTNSTPTFSGAAGTAAGDSSSITVKIFSGSGTGGSPVQTLNTTADGGAYSVNSEPLAPGTYTAQAEQTDNSQNVGRSSAVTFEILPPGARNADGDADGVPDTTDKCPTVPANTEDGCPLPEPVIGRRVNVQPVSGVVFVAVPGAKTGTSVPGLKGVRFVPLRNARQIPVGSFLDTRRGSVQVASAVDSTGKAQNGTFGGGVFQSLQARSGSRRGLTEITLKGSSFASCGSGSSRRASASAQPAHHPPRQLECPRALPHPRTQRLRHRAGHQVDHHRPLRRHPGQGLAAGRWPCVTSGFARR